MTTGKSADPVFRTDQIGSLIRPAELLDARDDYKAGRIDRAAQSAAEDKAIIEAQQEVIERSPGVNPMPTRADRAVIAFQRIMSRLIRAETVAMPAESVGT